MLSDSSGGQAAGKRRQGGGTRATASRQYSFPSHRAIAVESRTCDNAKRAKVRTRKGTGTDERTALGALWATSHPLPGASRNETPRQRGNLLRHLPKILRETLPVGLPCLLQNIVHMHLNGAERQLHRRCDVLIIVSQQHVAQYLALPLG